MALSSKQSTDTLTIDTPIVSSVSISKAKRVLSLAIEYAVLAPSSHNTQPWLFRVNDNSLELYADKERGLNVVDPHDRELIMSCGAALYNLRLALRSFGYTETTELFPHSNKQKGPNIKDLLARVTLTGIGHPNKEDKRLFKALPHRHTNRGRFETKPLDAALVNELELAVSIEGAQLYLTQDLATRQAIADLVAKGDKRQWNDPEFRSEIATWTHANFSKSRDGIPGYALNLNDVASYVTPFMIRRFDMGRGQAAKDHKLAEGSPALAVLYTAEDTPYYWLVAGQALSHLLVKARVYNFHASFLNQPIEIGELRTQLTETLGLTGFPQLLLRLGYAEEAKATPRRDVEEVVISD
jgi:hypothetical protein